MLKIRALHITEVCILENMLYEAIYQSDSEKKIPRSILNLPEINAYIKNFGEELDDYCLVADIDNNIVGAIWSRIILDEIKGFGFFNETTPELVISLLPEYRSQGIGTCLMTEMIEFLRKKKYAQVSLSVQKENYAVKLYMKMGFKIMKENSDDYLMLLNL